MLAAERVAAILPPTPLLPLEINGVRLWAKADKKWQRALARWSLQSSLSINRKVRALAGVQAWNPLQTGLPDSALVALTANQGL